MKVSTQTISYNHQDNDESINYKSLVLKYFRYWPFFLGSISLAVLIAFVVNQYTPPTYKIQSKFLIKEGSDPIQVFDLNPVGKTDFLPKGQKLANETVLLKSRVMAGEALDQLPFDVEYYNEGIFINPEIYKNIPVMAEVDWNHTQLTNGQIKISWENSQSFQLEFIDKEYEKFVPGEEELVLTERPVLPQRTYQFEEWIMFPFGRLRLNFKGIANTGTLVIKIRSKESLLQQYTGDNLQIIPVDKTSSILSLTLDTNQPQKGRDYLNMLMKVFLNNELNEKNSMARNTAEFIDRQLSGISDSLSYTENKLEKFRRHNRTYNISTEGNTIFEKLSELEKSLSHENFKLEYYQNLKNYIARENYSEIVVPAGLGIDDPLLNKLIEELIGFQSEKSRLLVTQTESSPTVVEVNRKINDLNTSIKEALKSINRNTGLVISDLEKQISKISSQFGKLPQTEQNLLNIKRRYTLNENIYTFLLQRRAEAVISLASNLPSNKIAEPAVLNLAPMRLRPLLNYILAILFGLIIPAGVIFVTDLFSIKIKEIKDVEQKLSVPVVGYIGQSRKYLPLVVFNQPRAGITEAFRGLRANIDYLFQRDKQVTILVTSSIAGEGKSFCALNLASVYSICGKKTIIVECDMHKRFAFNGLKLLHTKGLSSFLSGQITEFKNTIQKTEYTNLDVLVPGPFPPNPAELLISDRFKELIEKLKDCYDVIILDSSPLGLTNETLYLTRIADLTLFVLRQNYSNKAFVEDINALNEKKGVKKLYVVFNDIRNQYLNHGGYGYGYYDEDRKKQTPLKRLLKSISDKAAF